MEFKDPLEGLVFTIVSDRIPTLVPEVNYETRNLCSEIWNEPDLINKHKRIGRILGRLVRSGQLPLVKTGRSEANHSLYQLS